MKLLQVFWKQEIEIEFFEGEWIFDPFQQYDEIQHVIKKKSNKVKTKARRPTLLKRLQRLIALTFRVWTE